MTTPRPYLDGAAPLAFAHRGGAKVWPENTLRAFAESVALGYRHIETDIHLSRDGVPVILHDATIDRTTDGAGPVAGYTVAELRRFDAGYRFTRDGVTFPFRGQGLTIPTLEEALALDPGLRLNLEMKPTTEEMADSTWSFVQGRKDRERLLIASAHAPTIAAFRRRARGAIATSAGAGEILRFWMAARVGLHRRLSIDYDALQVPPRHGPLTVVNERFVRCAHERGLHVHVWTIDEPAEMRRLLALGVDGLMSDFPARLLQTLGRDVPEPRAASPERGS